MKKKCIPIWVSLLLFAFSLCSWGAYHLTGSDVNAQGILQEPFFLIPLGWVFLLFAVFSGLLNLTVRLVQK